MALGSLSVGCVACPRCQAFGLFKLKAFAFGLCTTRKNNIFVPFQKSSNKFRSVSSSWQKTFPHRKARDWNAPNHVSFFCDNSEPPSQPPLFNEQLGMRYHGVTPWRSLGKAAILFRRCTTMKICRAQRGRQAQMGALVACCWLALSSESLPSPVLPYERSEIAHFLDGRESSAEPRPLTASAGGAPPHTAHIEACSNV